MFWSAVLLAGMALLLVTAICRWYIAYLDRVQGEIQHIPFLGVEIGYSAISIAVGVIPTWGNLTRHVSLVFLGIGIAIFALDMAWVRRDERRFQANVARYVKQAKDE